MDSGSPEGAKSTAVPPSSDAVSLPTDAILGVGAPLGPRERATYMELAQIDRRLASIFLHGHRLARDVIGDDGAVYLLAHAGRELSRGVVRALLGDEHPMPPDSDDDLPETERNRHSIAAVLGQPPTHPAVTAWFRLNQTFARSCHLYVQPPDGTVVARAFIAFSDLLYGRVAPYFATAAELDALLTVTDPTDADVARAESLLARVQQRRYFFSKLEQPGWVAPLAARGHFANCPDRVVNADGSWQMRVWFEGEYLARVASRVPDAATEHLLRVPATLMNPAVWGVVVDAAMALPVGHAARLTKRIAKALAVTPPVLLPYKAVGLAARMATERDPSVWKLVDALLWCRVESDAVLDSEAPAVTWIDASRRANAALARLEPYELQRFCTTVLPALERFDAERALRVFVDRLGRVQRFVHAGVQDAASDDSTSRWWCESLAEAEDDDDVRSVLATAAARVAVALARSGEVGARAAWEQLQRPGDIFERLRLWVLIHASEHLQAELDAVVGGDQLLDPPYGAREAAALLRARFDHASPSARALFRYSLERGPDAAEIEAAVSWQREVSGPRGDAAAPPSAEHATAGARSTPEPPRPSEIDEVVRAWQAKRLRWFHDHIPSELQGLAERLGVQAEVPSERQQSLDEVGVYSSGVAAWVGSPSPRSSDELAAMDTADVLALLERWRPEDREHDEFSYRGLDEAIAAYAAAQPAPAVEVLAAAAATCVRPGYLTALLTGLRTAAMEGRDVPWGDALQAAEQVVHVADRAAAEAGESASVRTSAVGSMPELASKVTARFDVLPHWRFAVRAVADFVQAGCANDRPPHDMSAQVWSVLGALVGSPTVWSDRVSIGGTAGFERTLMNALNAASGETTRALVDAGLWEYRAQKRTPEETGSGELQEVKHLPHVGAVIQPLLDKLLAQDGEAALAVETMLGQLAPQLMLLAPRWFDEAEERLFAGGAEDPLTHPAWGAYVLRARFDDRTFSRLRQWYIRAAEASSAEEPGHAKAEASPEWSITRGLASHVLIAVIRGLAAVGDEDALVETTFARVPAAERARAYWEVFRSWSDVEEPPPAEFAERVVRFWAWRLAALESAAPSQARDEEAEGLLWFLKTPHLPPRDALQLGRRTIPLSPASLRASAGAWERLRELANAAPVGAFEVGELMIEQALARPQAYFPFDDVAPVLRIALAHGDVSVQARAKRLIHRLGESGHEEFGRLIHELNEPHERAE